MSPKPPAPWRARATALGLDALPIYQLRARVVALSGKATTSNAPDTLKRKIVKLTDAGSTSPTGVALEVEQPASTPAATDDGDPGSPEVEPSPVASPAIGGNGGASGGGARLAEGIYPGLDAATYHADPADGSTELRLWEHSWADAERRRKTGDVSAAMDVGTTIHTASEVGVRAVLAGGDALAALRCVTPDEDHIVGRDALKAACAGRDGFKGNWSTDAMEAWAREHAPDLRLWVDEIPRLRAQGLTPLEPADYDRAMRSIEAVRANPIAMQILDTARHEVSYVLQHEPGVWLKGRVDLAWHHLTIDLKTSARPEAYTGHKLDRLVAAGGWNVQAAMYEHIRARLGEDALGGGCVLVTSEAPHICEVIEYTDVDGADLMAAGRERFAACLENYTRHALNPRAWKGWSSKGEAPELVRLTSRGRLTA